LPFLYLLSWKHAIVTPIHKKDSKSVVSNYRPISLTSVPSKVFESILSQCIVAYLKRNNILSDAQHGFRAKRSTITQLILSVNDWSKALDTGNQVDIAYLDFARAFDSVSHPKLLGILDQLGFRGNILSWLRNYLTNRSQCVRIMNESSPSVPVTSSTPQGTVLGPLLFLIFINELPRIVQNKTISLFADDCKLHFVFQKNAPVDTLQNDLQTILDWSEEMQLSLSINKCAILHLGLKPSAIKKSEYVLGASKIQSVKTMRDLGIIVSEDLKWSSHCKEVTKKAGTRMYSLLRSFETKSTRFLVQLYKTFIRPKLDYGSPIWSPSSEKDILMVESVQRAFTKRIPELKKLQLSYADRLKRLSIDRLDLRRLKADAHKLLYHLCDIDLHLVSELLPFHQQSNVNYDGHILRMSKLSTNRRISELSLWLDTVRAHTVTRQRFFANRIVDVWNSLDADTRATGNPIHFKRRLNNETSDQEIIDLSPFLTHFPQYYVYNKRLPKIKTK
jgi:hypothetical protein